LKFGNKGRTKKLGKGGIIVLLHNKSMTKRGVCEHIVHLRSPYTSRGT